MGYFLLTPFSFLLYTKRISLIKLRQYSDIRLKQHLDIRDAVFEHCDTLDAHAECEAGVDMRNCGIRFTDDSESVGASRHLYF